MAEEFPPTVAPDGRRPHLYPMMITRSLSLSVLLVTLALPAAAQDAPAPQDQPPGTTDEGFSLLEEGVKLIFRGILNDMEPTLNQMSEALDEVEPALRSLSPKLREFMALVGDLENYHAPEKLENGDILIRRKSEAEILLDGLKGTDVEL
jgi:hypothetical protein